MSRLLASVARRKAKTGELQELRAVPVNSPEAEIYAVIGRPAAYAGAWAGDRTGGHFDETILPAPAA